MEVIYRGFDGLDVSFQGALPGRVVEALEAAKELAKEVEAPQPVRVGPGGIELLIDITGNRNGYAYRCSTGPDGETWFFKKSNNPTEYNIRVSCGSAGLACRGYEGTKLRLYEILEGLGATVLSESIGRVDFCVDFLAPDFVLRSNDFVCHSSTVRGSYEESDVSTSHKGRRTTSVTVGKMPNRQIIIYDKRAEVISKRKEHWWKIWDLDKNYEGNKVWRVEVRAGKRHLKEKWNITSWQDLEASICDLFKKAMNDIRYLSPDQTDTNATRMDVDPIWEITTEEIGNCLRMYESGVEPSDIREVELNKAVHTYETLIKGCAAGLAAVLDYDGSNLSMIVPRLERVLRSDIRENREGFEKKVSKARDRFIFIRGNDERSNRSSERVGSAFRESTTDAEGRCGYATGQVPEFHTTGAY